jgi:nitroimidazol reductase NimA-like FMN-containing flavoprotein (pyridoxamine 5'-phosphate oxidase superfamily)
MLAQAPMVIEDLSRQNCIDLLARKRLGRLACAQDQQPYITPFFFAYHSEALYSFSTVGQKITWMRSNPLVCVEVDEIESPQNWSSVIVLGHYEELPPTAEFDPERRLAHNLLQQRPTWWEPAYVKTASPERDGPPELVYFRIYTTNISGRQARPLASF